MEDGFLDERKTCFRDFPAGPAGIFFTNARQRGFHREFFLRHGAVGEQEIFFVDAAAGELFRERFVGERRLAEDKDAAGFLVQPMNDGERGPARFTVAQPVVDALAGVRRRRVRVPAGGLVDRQQMLILKNYARNHAQMKTFFAAQMKARKHDRRSAPVPGRSNAARPSGMDLRMRPVVWMLLRPRTAALRFPAA